MSTSEPLLSKHLLVLKSLTWLYYILPIFHKYNLFLHRSSWNAIRWMYVCHYAIP